MKTYVLYHGNCPDGFGAAFAAWLKFGGKAEYVPVSYGKPMPNMERMMEQRAIVHILDFSYTREVLEALSDECAVSVVDHHATAQQDLTGLPYCMFDMTKSGAVLAWEFYHGGPVPEFFRYLQDRDLWRWELPGSREVSAAVRSYPFEFTVWSALSGIQLPRREEIERVRINALEEEGRTCLRMTQQQVENMARHYQWADFLPAAKEVMLRDQNDRPQDLGERPGAWWSAPAVNATAFVSEVGERLLQMFPEAPFVAFYADVADKRQWGLRSRPGFDCSAVAKAFGGGGHKQASGFVQ